MAHWLEWVPDTREGALVGTRVSVAAGAGTAARAVTVAAWEASESERGEEPEGQDPFMQDATLLAGLQPRRESET